MLKKTELEEWLESVPDDGEIAIDKEGNSLISYDADRNELDGWCEVGGPPDDEESNEDLESENPMLWEEDDPRWQDHGEGEDQSA